MYKVPEWKRLGRTLKIFRLFDRTMYSVKCTFTGSADLFLPLRIILPYPPLKLAQPRSFEVSVSLPTLVPHKISER